MASKKGFEAVETAAVQAVEAATTSAEHAETTVEHATKKLAPPAFVAGTEKMQAEVTATMEKTMKDRRRPGFVRPG